MLAPPLCICFVGAIVVLLLRHWHEQHKEAHADGGGIQELLSHGPDTSLCVTDIQDSTNL